MRSSSAYVIVAIGTLHIVSEPKEALEEFARVGRLLNTLLRADPGLQAEYLKGSVIYRVLSQTVDYDEIYHVLTAVSWSKDIIYAEVCFKTEDRSVGTVFEKCIQSLTLDAFMQAAILQTACCHSPLSAEKTLTCTGIGSVRFSPGFMPARVGDKWTIFATSTTVNQDRHEYDIFARDMKTNILTIIITGVQVCAVPTTLLSPSTVTRAPKNIIKSNLPQVVQHNAFNAGGAGKDTNLKLRDILERHIQLPSVMDESMRLSEIGVDSLLFIELCSDLERELGIQLPQHQVTIGSQLCEISRLIYSKMDLDAPQAQHTENGQNVCSRKDHTVQSCDIQGDSHPWLRHVLGSYVQLPSVLDESTRLSDLGVDSLIYIELSGDIEQTYGVQLSRHHITIGSQLREISRLLDQPALDIAAPVLSICEYGQTRSSDVNPAYIGSHSAPLLRSWKVPPQAAIIRTSQRFQDFAIECGCKDFWSLTNPAQAGLLQAYALETFEKLGSEIKSLDHGQEVRGVSVLPKYERLVKVLLDLLRTGGILDYTGHSYIRSDRCVDFSQSPAHLSDNLIHEFPQYTTDFQLLHVTASRMASILTGEDDPLHRLFGIPRSRALLEDLYINSPMFKVMSRLVSHFLGDVLSNANFDRPIRILEVGAGVGGTTIELEVLPLG
jgi:acyl carrier protein